MVDSRLAASRRIFVASAASALLLPIGYRSLAQPLDQLTPLRCADFLAGIGVNTHINYLDSQYRDVSAIRDALRYVGIRYVRDGAPAGQGAAHFETLAADGVSFCLFLGAKRAMADLLGQVSALEAVRSGAVHALEGPNEIKPTFEYGGRTGNDAGRQLMIDMRSAAAAEPRLHRKPLVAFTSYEPVACDCDFANQHPYPKGGQQPGIALRRVRDRNVGPNGVMPGKPMVFTEFGYHTLVGEPARPGAWQGVDPERQAALIVNALLDNAVLGISRTYIYQLLDGSAEMGGLPNQEKHFGLFAFDGSPKPAATALKTLSALLADTGPDATRFTPKHIDARVAVNAPVSCLAMQDSSGRDYLAFWNESPIWNKEAFRPMEADSASATIALPGPAAVQAIDIIDSGRTRDFGRARQVAIEVGSHPVIVRIG